MGDVKTWQPKLACSLDTTCCNVTQANFNSRLYKSLTIGGTGCAATFNNSNASAVANDFVLLQEGFEASGSATITVSTPTCQDGQEMIFNSVSNPTPPYHEGTMKNIKKTKSHD